MRRGRDALTIVQPRTLALKPFSCPLCGPTLLVRLAPNPIGVRCVRCAASAVTMSLVSVLRSLRPEFSSQAVYELSARGPLYEFLRRNVARLICSEYLDGVPPGTLHDGVLCQDVQKLTFAAATFDVCTSTEVFEHVADDALGFREIRRVLRESGVFVFTVPLGNMDATVERARLKDGEIEYLLPPVYHGDRIRGHGRVLAFRDYGRDITSRLRASGFSDAFIDWRFRGAFLGQGCGVVVAAV